MTWVEQPVDAIPLSYTTSSLESPVETIRLRGGPLETRIEFVVAVRSCHAYLWNLCPSLCPMQPRHCRSGD